MKKIWGGILLAAVLVICMGMTGIIPVDVDQVPDDSIITMYSEDGRTEDVPIDEADEQKTVGWYDNINDVITTMWAEDGNSIIVFNADVDKYSKEGYTKNYNSIFKQITNIASGEQKYVLKSDVQGYLDTGWKRGNGKVDPDQPMVCLTFDDGPNPTTTNRLLNALEENSVNATFFMLGKLTKTVKGSDATLKRMKEIGSELGSHTYDHTQLTKLNKDALKEQIEGSAENIDKSAGGAEVKVMRPPYGSYNDAVKAACVDANQAIVLWSVDTLDWKSRNADTVYNVVMDTVQDGDIILFHDIYESSVDAAIKIIPALLDEGYQIVTFEEMAEAKIGGMKAGEVYTDFRDSTVMKINAKNDNSSSSNRSDSSDSKSTATPSPKSAKSN